MKQLLHRLMVLLEPKAVRQAYGLMVGMTGAALLEALGVGLIFPFIVMIDDPTRIHAFPHVESLATSLGLVNSNQLLIFLSVALALLFLVKNVYLGVMYHAQFRFAFEQQIGLAKRLYEYYLRSPYQFHLERNSSELLRNINSETTWIFHHVVIPLMSIFAELCVVLLLGGLLLVAAPLMSLIAFGFLGIVGGIMLIAVRRKSAQIGQEHQARMGEMIRFVNEGLGSVKEAKVYGVEGYFLEAFQSNSEHYARANVFLKSTAMAPRLIVETLGIGGILVACIVLLVSGANLREYLPHLGLFAVAAVRLMPSMNRIMSSLTGVRFFTASVDAVYDDFIKIQNSQVENAVTSWLSIDSELALEDIRFSYGEAPVLSGLSITVRPGESIGFAGPSGAGKSTLVNIILGLLIPDSGRVLVDGKPLDSSRENRVRVGYIPQSVRLLDESIRRNVAFGEHDEIDDHEVWQALDAAQLAETVRSLPEGLDAMVGEDGVRLSGGQRQRLGIARALYTGARLLVFDEATSALDSETERGVVSAIGQLRGERTLIQIAHRLSTLKDCDRIYVMNQGQIHGVGSFEELRLSDEIFQTLLAEDVKNTIPRHGADVETPSAH